MCFSIQTFKTSIYRWFSHCHVWLLAGKWNPRIVIFPGHLQQWHPQIMFKRYQTIGNQAWQWEIRYKWRFDLENHLQMVELSLPCLITWGILRVKRIVSQMGAIRCDKSFHRSIDAWDVDRPWGSPTTGIKPSQTMLTRPMLAPCTRI